jgi:hypothetical protein
MSIPVEAGNEAIKSGRMGPLLERVLGELNPEATYFYSENGRRHGLIVFDLKDSSDIPRIAEPLFMELNAQIDMHPCMNMADVKAGLAKAAAAL